MILESLRISLEIRDIIKFGYHCPEHCPLKCGKLGSTLFLKLAFKFCPVCPMFVAYFGSLFLYSPSLAIDPSWNHCFISWTLKITRVCTISASLPTSVLLLTFLSLLLANLICVLFYCFFSIPSSFSTSSLYSRDLSRESRDIFLYKLSCV